MAPTGLGTEPPWSPVATLHTKWEKNYEARRIQRGTTDNEKGGEQKVKTEGRQGRNTRHREIEPPSTARHQSEEARGPGDNIGTSLRPRV